MKRTIVSLMMIAVLLLNIGAMAEATPVRVAALKGPTGMGLVQMMANNEEGQYEYSLSGAIDVIPPQLIRGELDIAAVPANLSSVLYQSTKGQIVVLAINTLGILYIVERGDTIHSIEDLRGRTIYSSGKGASPEYALNYVLAQNGIDPEKDVIVEYKSEHAECLAALLSDDSAVAMLPQPFVTIAQSKRSDIRIALDWTAEWDAIGTDGQMLTGVVVARRSFVDSHPEAVTQFLAAYADSVAYVNEHVSEAAELMGQLDIFDANIAEAAIPYCNIVLITGDEMKDMLSGYLSVLYTQDAAAVGGALPEDDFYYGIS